MTPYDRYFLSYSSPKLPLKMVNPLGNDEIDNRNTYFGANFDNKGRLTLVQQLVYGSIELSHQYEYDENDNLLTAEIKNADDEIKKLWFSPDGQITRQEDLDD
ncbi:DUF6156 family protein [Oceanobacter mangrovi]|uniref:DUF6156 family protein n=1 Tax=Oceanobacter mangrovi TaxID=2862510 RepID=UPI001C8D7977|nr:DUF6156 family protein [Oceanobacter mangrovi]